MGDAPSADEPPVDDGQLVRLFVDRVRDYAIFLLTPTGHVATWNAGAARIKGYRADEVIGEHFSRFYTDEDREAGLPAKALAGAEREGSFEHEGWRVRRDGSRFWAAVTITAVRDDRGELRGFGKVTRDLTERRAAEERLRRSNADLQEFAYVASHDLSEPLRTVSGFAQLLSRRYGDALDERAHAWIGHITDGTQRMQTLIDDLLQYSRAGGGDLASAPVDLDRVVRRVREALIAGISARGAELAVGELPTVTGDERLLRQVVHNLVANAIKFVPPDRAPVVEVSAERVPEGWRVVVADNGIGIAPHHAEQIFGMFKRLHARDEYPGTGIGLAIARRVVERHGGRIWFEPGRDGGSRFCFTIPDREA